MNANGSAVTVADLKKVSENNLPKEGCLFDAILLKTNFDYKDFGRPSFLNGENEFIAGTKNLIDKAKAYLKDGGLFFIWGLPNYLSFLAKHLGKEKDNYNYLFKYWIGVEINSVLNEGLPSSHIGLLMYLKSKSLKQPTPFDLNTKFVRVPYVHCPACGEINKDWGGKKHLLNPLGSAISDVWDFHKEKLVDNKIPKPVTERLLKLLGKGKTLLQINQSKERFTLSQQIQIEKANSNGAAIKLQADKVIEVNCINYLKGLKKKYPQGVFDLVFADPPYNLDKNYSTYKDDRADEHYIQWCNEWLKGMYENLKPGGALFVLNIPKWSIYHFNFLTEKMIFKNWIVWDAISTPAGKFLPAHYSLLYFVKPGGKPTINFKDNELINSRKYCLKSSCRKKRKEIEKEQLTDIWKDVHRIKHKKDRDHHPCQLPTKLMERIIKLFSNEGNLIFDPFGGAGTTAVAAKVLNRKFIITDIDNYYINISKKNLERLKKDVTGQIQYQRESTKKLKLEKVPKKQFEKRYLDLSVNQKKPLNADEIESFDKELYTLLKFYKGSFSKIYATARRKIETLNVLN